MCRSRRYRNRPQQATRRWLFRGLQQNQWQLLRLSTQMSWQMGTHWKWLDLYLLYAEPSRIGRANRYHMFQFGKIHRIWNCSLESQPCFLVLIMSIRALSADASTRTCPCKRQLFRNPEGVAAPFLSSANPFIISPYADRLDCWALNFDVTTAHGHAIISLRKHLYNCINAGYCLLCRW